MEHDEIRDALCKGGYHNLAELLIYSEALDIEHFDIMVSINGVLRKKQIVVPDTFEGFAGLILEDDLDDVSIEFLRDLNNGCTMWLDELIPLYEQQNSTQEGGSNE